MGQMHVQRSLEMARPPAAILATDVSAERLASMEKKFRPLAEKNSICLEILNPKDFDSPEDFEKAVRKFSGAVGFDDVVVLAPLAVVIEQSAPFLASGGIMNIFAGVPLGTMAGLDL
ncbi:MAG: alcohol dehydrogenase, partial [Acidobacteria bacterium]|nr:alcohol dehydrogenase [Acidobacteriota bacterium]